MRLETLSQNEHWLNFNTGSICFSYDTAVAVHFGANNTYYVNEKYAKRSSTTSKHINKFTNKKHIVIPENQFAEKMQAVLNGFRH